MTRIVPEARAARIVPEARAARATLEAAIRGQVHAIARTGRTQRDGTALGRELEQRITMLMASAEAYASAQLRLAAADAMDPRHS